MTHKLEWLTSKLRAPSGDPEVDAIHMDAAASAIDTLMNEVAHARSNWETLQSLPDLPARTIAERFVQYESINGTLNAGLGWKREGLLVRLTSVIDRARVDGGIAAQRRNEEPKA
jgi:hypothetical protein